MKDLYHGLRLLLKAAGAVLWGVGCVASANAQLHDEYTELSLQSAIQLAQEKDSWQQKSQALEQELLHLSEGATALPDPTFSIGLQNLPTNGFAFDQEPMTQMKVGVSQMLPRGRTLHLEQNKHQLNAAEQPYLRQDRQQKIALLTTQLWLDAFQANASIALIEDARPIFAKLSEIAGASYAASSGTTNQQDIIRGELELARLNDRLIELDTQKAMAFAKLKQFVFDTQRQHTHVSLPNTQPLIQHFDELTVAHSRANSIHRAMEHMATHPLVLAFEQKINASSVDTKIAKQAYQPQWGVNASYAYRDDDPIGASRADFFSVGLQVNIPLFSTKRQDSQVSASILKTQALVTQKQLLVRELMAGLQSAYAQLTGTRKRKIMYETQIIPQVTQHAKSALNAYTNDRGSFTDVLRARIDELDANLEQLKIITREHKALAHVRYYLHHSLPAKQVTHE